MSFDDDKPMPEWLWARNLGEEVVKELLRNGHLVPAGSRLPVGWDISLDGWVVCPLPSIDSDEMLYLVLKRRSQLPDTLKSKYGVRAWQPVLAGYLGGRAGEADQAR